MNHQSAKLTAAADRSIEARQRFAATLDEAKARLAPAQLMRENGKKARAKAQDAAFGAMEYARANPLHIAGAVAVIALLLARRPLFRLVASRTGQAVKPQRQRRVSSRRTASSRKDRP